MKTEIIKILTFACMVLVLGTQALLHGSWRVQETEPLKSKNGGNL
ncbi:MAG: hypothetical protein ABJN95_06730 [Maribacter sp.]